MNHLPARMYLDLLRLDMERGLLKAQRRRIAEARRRFEQDRRALEQAWLELDSALEAEARSRREFLSLSAA